jgi:hypothetical protein
MRLECRLVLFTRRQTYLIESNTKVECGEPGCRRQLIQQVIYDWYGKLAFHCEGVEHAVVDAEAPKPFFQTRSIGEENERVLGLINPICIMSNTCFSISDFNAGAYL